MWPACWRSTIDVHSIRRLGTLTGMRVTPRRLALAMSLWIPNLFSGIRVRRYADDWTEATVELHVNVFTRNYVKTAFGGSMSAMTDPYFFMLVMHQLGRDYVVWDTRGEIEFLKPGRGVLTAQFAVPREKAAELRERARGGAKVLEWFETEITDRSGDVVARVRREVYVREKKRVTQAAV
jgi:acyl-coenzyme A thioesterase PaaI-like protein